MIVDDDGNEIVGPIPFPLKARNSVWLLLQRQGVPVPMIAARWRVNPETVRTGIRRARLSREGKPPAPSHMHFGEH